MAKGSLIFLCACLITTQIVIVLSDEENYDWTTIQDEIRKLTGSIRKKCLAESGADIETLEDVEMGEFPDDAKLACYFKCVMETGGVLKKGQINFKLLAKMMPAGYKSIAMEMIDECRNVAGSDSCDLAYKFNECLYTSNPGAFFVI